MASLMLRWMLVVLLAAQAFSSVHCQVRLNQIQYIGTHNSYKSLWNQFWQAEAKYVGTERALGIAYQHPNLAQQLDLGMRSIEIDVFYDPIGTNYTSHPLAAFFGLADPYAYNAALRQPGFKPNDSPPDPSLVKAFGALSSLLTVPVTYSADAFNALDTEIRKVFTNVTQLITPDVVRGAANTLREAIEGGSGWPTVQQARGKVYFVMDIPQSNAPRFIPMYLGCPSNFTSTTQCSRPNLEGRVLFISEGYTFDVTQPYTSVITIDNPLLAASSGIDVTAVIKQGFIVHVVRTDFPIQYGSQPQSPYINTTYSVSLPSNVIARCSPVQPLNAPPCTDSELVEPGVPAAPAPASTPGVTNTRPPPPPPRTGTPPSSGTPSPTPNAAQALTAANCGLVWVAVSFLAAAISVF
eukprot:jgi/Chlat1/5318/Chrsp35S05256